MIARKICWLLFNRLVSSSVAELTTTSLSVRLQLAHTGPDVSGRLLNFYSSPIKGDVLGQKPIQVMREGEAAKTSKTAPPGWSRSSFSFFFILVVQSRYRGLGADKKKKRDIPKKIRGRDGGSASDSWFQLPSSRSKIFTPENEEDNFSTSSSVPGAIWLVLEDLLCVRVCV